MKIKVLSREYNSMRGSNADYSKWITGGIYYVTLPERVIKMGWYNSDPITLADESDVVNMERNADPEAIEISISDMTDICQDRLFNILGDEFPWEESIWENHAAYLEWSSPNTLTGMINKSIRDRHYFYNDFYLSIIWINCIEEMHTILQCSNTCDSSGEDLVKLNGEWYTVKYGMSSENGYWAKLIAISEETAMKTIERLNTKNEIDEAKRIAAQEKAAANRIAYARRCGRLSRKYHIRFEIVLSLSDNDKKIKRFVVTLKKAINHGCVYSALYSYSEEERGDELERLGFERSLSKKVACYIADCIIAGSILM